MSNKAVISDIDVRPSAPAEPADQAPLPQVEEQSTDATAKDKNAKPLADNTAKAEKTSKKPKAEKSTKRKVFGAISKDMAEYIIDSLSMLLTAGVTVGESLESIATEITDKKTKAAITQMRSHIDEGMQFSKAIEQTGLFSASVVTLIEIGETSGRLPQNLRVVADQMHKNNQMSARIKSAMLYPAFLVTLLFAVGTGIGVFLLPKLIGIVKGLGEKVGPITRGVIFVGTYFGKYGLVGAGGLVVLGLGLGIGIKINPKMRVAAETVLYHIPGIKKLLFQTEVARFGFILGSLLDAGLPIVAALQSLSSSMSTKRYQRFALKLSTAIDEGNSFGTLLTKPEFRDMLSGTICQVIISAEKSGSLASSLLKIGEDYQDKADITARNLETLLEPIVLVLIAIAVLFVALAVFLPIYSLIGQFNSATTPGVGQ